MISAFATARSDTFGYLAVFEPLCLKQMKVSAMDLPTAFRCSLPILLTLSLGLLGLAAPSATLADTASPTSQTEQGSVSQNVALAFVTNQGDNSVSVIDADSYQSLATISVGDQPAGVTVDPEGQRAYVSNPGGGTVSVIDIDALSVVGTYKIGDGPLALIAGAKTLYVADWYADVVSVIDTSAPLNGSGLTEPRILARYPVGRSPSGLVLSPDEHTLYVSNRDDNNVQALVLEKVADGAEAADTADFTSGNKPISRLANTGERPFGMTLNQDGTILYVANVKSNSMSVINTASMETIAEVPVGERPYAVALALGDSLAFVTDQYDDTVTIINTADLSIVDTLDVGEYPEGIATHPDDRHVIVANWFSNTVEVIDATTLEIVNTIDVGDGPRAYGNFITTPKQ